VSCILDRSLKPSLGRGSAKTHEACMDLPSIQRSRRFRLGKGTEHAQAKRPVPITSRLLAGLLHRFIDGQYPVSERYDARTIDRHLEANPSSDLPVNRVGALQDCGNGDTVYSYSPSAHENGRAAPPGFGVVILASPLSKYSVISSDSWEPDRGESSPGAFIENSRLAR